MTLTAKEVFSWAASAKAGDVLVYRDGPHLHEGEVNPTYSDAVHAVRHLYNRGTVDLVQKRIGKMRSRFEYRAIKRAVPAFVGSRFHVPARIFETAQAA